MNQETHYEDDIVEIDLREYLNILWQRKWIIIGLFIIAVVSSYFISKSMTEIYQTESLIMVQEQNNTEDMFSEQLSFTTGNDNKIATYSEMIKSRRILNKVIKSLNLRNVETNEYISVSSLKNRISITNTGDTDLMRLSVTYSDPKIAKQIANKIITVFKEENLEMNMADLQGASDFISTQLEDTKKQLTELEKELLKYQKENKIYYPGEQGKKLLEQLSNLEKGLVEAKIEINQAKAALNTVNKKLNNESKTIISSKTISRNPIIGELKSKLSSLQTDLSAKKEVYTDKHPEIQQLNTKIKSVENELNKKVKEIVSAKTETTNPLFNSLRDKKISLETNIISAQARQQSYQNQIKNIENELNDIPDKELTLARLQREKTITEDIYLMLKERQEEINIQKSMKTSDIVVVDPAIVKENPIKPNIKLNLAIAGVLGLMLGVFIIFLIEFFDNRVKEEKDVEKITGLPVLGVIPNIDEVDHKQGYGRGEKYE